MSTEASLSRLKRNLNTYRASVEQGWRGEDATLFLVAIDNQIREIDKILSQISSLRSDISAALEDIRREEEERRRRKLF